MKISVITPVGPSTDPDHLAKCCDSVEAQSGLDQDISIEHHLVLDGPKAEINDWSTNLSTIRLPSNVGDIGSTPRTIGAVYAWGLGADAVAFLDSDCYYHEHHIKAALDFAEKTSKPVICSGRVITDWSGDRRAPCRETVPGSGFHDTNTFLFTRDAIALSYTFGTLTGPDQHKIGDRILSRNALRFLACHYHPTVVYRSRHRCHYLWYNWPEPDVELKDLSAPSPESANPKPAAAQ